MAYSVIQWRKGRYGREVYTQIDLVKTKADADRLAKDLRADGKKVKVKAGDVTLPKVANPVMKATKAPGGGLLVTVRVKTAAAAKAVAKKLGIRIVSGGRTSNPTPQQQRQWVIGRREMEKGASIKSAWLAATWGTSEQGSPVPKWFKEAALDY